MQLHHANSLKIGSSVIKSPRDRATWYAKHFRPLGDTQPLSVVSDKPCGRPVSTLFGLGSPSAIIGAIRAVAIYSINRMLLGWSFSHIRHKEGEVIPSRTHAHALSSVKVILKIRRVIASCSHIYPRLVEAMLLSPVRKTVFSVPVRNNFGSEAPTAFDRTATERPNIDPLNGSAVTPNLVIPVVTSFFLVAQRRVSSVFNRLHSFIRIMVDSMYVGSLLMSTPTP
jgi:hypothetical protein